MGLVNSMGWQVPETHSSDLSRSSVWSVGRLAQPGPVTLAAECKGELTLPIVPEVRGSTE